MTTTSILDLVQDGWPGALTPKAATTLLDIAVLERLEQKSSGAIRALQSKRLGALVGYARANSTTWRERLPVACRDWSMLPILSREDYKTLAQSGPLQTPNNPKPAYENSTSGSSGIPVAFYYDDLTARMNHSLNAANVVRQGCNDGRPFAAIIPNVASHSGEYIKAKGRRYLGEGPQFVRRARQFTIEAHARWLAQSQCPYLATVPTVLRGMIDVYEAGCEHPAPVLDKIFSYAETVDPELRLRAKATFGCDIADSYSCEETGPIAFQCPNGLDYYHVAVSNVIVDVVNVAGRPCPDGAPGRIIVTSLNNYASPAIRYEIGDIGALHPRCPCGFSGPALSGLLGRTRFLIRLPSGEHKYVGTASKLWVEAAPIKERRIVQISEGRLRAEIVMERPLTQAEREKILTLLQREISFDLDYEIVELDAIDWAPTYKRQDVISLI